MHPPRGTRRPPKKSLTVRFPVPRAAATILRSMAISKDPRLLELGVLAVQFKDNERIAIGLGVEKEPWEKDEGFKQEPASVQRSKASEMFAQFSDDVELLSSNVDRHNTAGKHNNRDVIYAGNGLCSNNNTAAEEKASQVRLNVGEGSSKSSSDTRSRVVGGIRSNVSLERIARKQASDLQSEATSRNQSDMPPGRILPPLSRRKRRDAGSPGSTKSESSKRGKASQPMLDMFFDQGRFSAASMLMQLAKNHTSKGDTDTQERAREHNVDIDSDKPVIAGISTSANKVRVVTQASPHKITQKITAELMEDEEMWSSSSGDSPAPVVQSKSSTDTPRTSYDHCEQNKHTIASKPHDITSDSQSSTGNDSSYVRTWSPTTWSGHHISPIHLVNSSVAQSHKDSAPSQTVWSSPSVLSNSRTAHGSCDQMSKGSANTQTAWSSPSVLSNSRTAHGSLDQMSKGSADSPTAWSNPSVLCNSQTTRGSLDQMSKGSADTQTTWSNPSVCPRTQSHSNVRQSPEGSDDAQTTGSGCCVSSNSATADQEDMGRVVNTLTTSSSNPDISTNVVNSQTQLGLYQQNVAHYPVSYVTYPLGFVYPYITLSQGVNAVKSEPEKKAQSEIKSVQPPQQSVTNHTEQEHDSSTRAPSKNTNTVQWVIPQVQAGNVVQQAGQFIDLASSLRYWQQLSVLYRSQFQALAGNLQYTSNTSAVTSSPAGYPQNTAAHSKGKEIDTLLGKESQDINNNNLTVGCDKSAGNEGNQSQAEVAGFKSQNSLSNFELEQSSSHNRLGKSQPISPVFGSKVNPKTRRASVIHVVEPNENKAALGTCTNALGPSDQHLWGRHTSLSEKPERSEHWLGSSKCYSSSAAVTSSSEDTSSPVPDTNKLFDPLFPVQKPSLRFGEPHGLLREVERGSAPELSFVHENSIAYMNVRSHSDYGSKELKKAASRNEGVCPAKRKKSKKSL